MPRISSCAPLRLMCRFKLRPITCIKFQRQVEPPFLSSISLSPCCHWLQLLTRLHLYCQSSIFSFFFFFLHLNPWGDLGDSSAPFILFCLHSFRIWKVFLAGSFVLTAQSIQFSHSQVFYAARRDGICSRTESICRRVLILPRHYGLKLKGVLSSSLAQLCVHVSSTGHTSYSQLVKISFLILRRT